MQTNSTILLVDDDPDDLFILSDAFKTADPSCEIVEAYDGDAALQLLNNMFQRKVVPDLIVLDINMPILDGREMLRQLKSNDRYKDIPVIVYTTSSNSFDKLHCAQFDVELITKPSTLTSIEQAVRDMLRYLKRPAA
jgi:two-component system, response regulator